MDELESKCNKNAANRQFVQLTSPIEYERFQSFAVSIHTEIGDRKSQEDRFVAVPSFSIDDHEVAFFGVFDGTVGDFASSTIQKIIVSHLIETEEWKSLMSHFSKPFLQEDQIPKLAAIAMNKMYINADKELLRMCEANSINYSSSTGVTVVLVDDLVVIGHLGDSRACICYSCNDVVVSKFLTIDHKPNNVAESRRIQACGGSVEYLCSHSNKPFIRGGDFTQRKANGDTPMQLQYSRAFGGKDLKMFGLSSEPDVLVFKRNEHHKGLVLASDGLWDVKSSDDVFKHLFYAREWGKNPSKFLIDATFRDQRLRGKKADNITVIALFFPE
ncbi:bifunctional PPM-type phosphatase domain/PPM-type phosphatase domain superfamily [Babesia duncani]|uniref:Bifunctional PPM-type phosphatase domain/PPM-type phosphatase domain superfamily n=1 Tax=Babesia duncani TaxID=323732 RepID=A0AAD9PPD7_9APIC|nr:bifunctional PPM-type phosphatase domain/PPM-type phosphatase domain superfamily [Babesia duncani]